MVTNRYFKFSWGILNVLLLLLAGFFHSLAPIVLISGVITNLILIYHFRHIQPAMIMMIFFLSYLGFLIPYFFFDIVIAGHTKYYKAHLFNEALVIHVLFITTFFVFLNPSLSRSTVLLRELIPVRNNSLIFWGLFIAMTLVVVSIKGESVISSNGDSYATYIQNIDEQGGSLEYFYILFICAFFFSDKRFNRWMLLILFFVYSYKCGIRGYRIQLVQLTFLVFLLFFDGKFKSWILITMCVLGYVASEVISILKTVGNFSFEALAKVFDFSTNAGVVITNQTDVFYSSVVFLGLIEDSILDLKTRIWSAVGFMVNWVVPSSFVWQEARLPEFGHKFTTFGGGGLVSVYFYVWFGYLGVIMLGVGLAYLFNQVFTRKIRVFKLLMVMLLTVYPRWFAYDPGNFLMRFPLYLLVFFCILCLIDKEMKHNMS